MKISMQTTAEGLVRALRWDREQLLETILGQKRRMLPMDKPRPAAAERRAKLRGRRANP